MFLALRSCCLAYGVLGLSALTPALAQSITESEDGVRVFEPSYFDEFDPIDVLDMVDRTPGFNAQESDGGRGLAGVRSNILIDGERPPPKGRSIQQILGEMPVNSIQRIELIDAGARLDIDMQGYPQVVNVITVPDRPAYLEVITEVWKSGTGDPDQRNERNSELEAIGSFGWNAHEFLLRGGYRDRNNRSPADFVSIDPANPEQRISSLNGFERQDKNLDLNAIFRFAGDSSLTLNGDFGSQRSSSAPIQLLDDPQDTVDQASTGEEDRQDISAEYRRPVGPAGTLMLAVVDARSTDDSASILRSSTSIRSSLNDRESGETAVRALLTQSPNERITIRTTATTAFNYFEGGFRLFEDEVERPVAGSDSRVEEDRSTIETAADWNWSSRWTFTGSAGVEAYEIETRDLSSGLQTDPKGHVSVLFRPQPRTTVTLESRRDIGQLSFGRFLASANLSSEIITAGAAALEPERRWRHSATYDKRFGDLGVWRVQLTREKTDNPVRQVALSDSLIVYQNTSPQTIDSLRASIEYPFENFGRPDLILRLNGRLADSETIDPVTGETREVSGLNPYFWSVQIRRDPGSGRLAWSFAFGNSSDGDNYSVRSIRTSTSDRQWEAFLEWEPIDGLKFRPRIEGPRNYLQLLSLYPEVRKPGLAPSFLATTSNEVDSSASFSVEWRRREHFEITASLSTRPRTRTEESLSPYGQSASSMLAREIATTPRAMLRFRFYN